MTEYHDRASGPPRELPSPALRAIWSRQAREVPRPSERIKYALMAAGVSDADAMSVLLEHQREPSDMVWMGDLSGWEVAPAVRDTPPGTAAPLGLALYHRCGWSERLPECGMQADGGLFVGNLVERVLEILPGHVCTEQEPSPEQQERMARWMAAAGLQPSGDVAMDQRSVARNISRAARLRRRGSVYADQDPDADLGHPRPADGPGCTPAVVPGILRTFNDVANTTADVNAADGPPAGTDIPCPRCSTQPDCARLNDCYVRQGMYDDVPEDEG